MVELKFIKEFSQINKHDIPIVGGKGANLGEMTQKGLDVPPGFCVTAQAYKYFIGESHLNDEIRTRIDSLDIEDSAELQKTSEEIQKLINSAQIPEDLENEIISAYVQ